MSFLTQGKTNWQLLLIVVVLAAIVGGGIWWFIGKRKASSIEFPEIEEPKKFTEAECRSIQDVAEQAKCFIDLAIETKNESYCEKVEIPGMPLVKANCYSELAILKNNPSICWKVGTASLASSCWEYFGMKDWQIYRNEELGFEIKYPSGWFLKEGIDEGWIPPGRVIDGITLNSPEREDLKDQEIGGIYREDITITIEKMIDYGVTTIEEFIEKEVTNRHYAYFSLEGKITIAGRDALGGITGSYDEGYTIFVENSGCVYKIGFLPIYSEDLGETERKILSTFRFIEEDETADWQTYRNEEYRFEMRYPEGFTEQKVESEDILLSITRDGSHYFVISVRKEYNINQITSSIEEAKEMRIGDHLGYEYFYVEGAGASEVLLIQVGQDALNISLDYIGDESFPIAEDKKNYVQSVFNQILSTFRFIGEEPSLKIISPNGGENWMKGNNYTIRWDQKRLETWGNKAVICLEGFDAEDNAIFAKEEWQYIQCAWETGGGPTPYLITTEATLNKEEYKWDVPEDIFGRFEKPPTFFKITLRVFDNLPPEGRTEWAGQIEKDESDNYFNITE